MNLRQYGHTERVAPTEVGYVVPLSRNRAVMRCGTHASVWFRQKHAEVDYMGAIQEILKHNLHYHNDDQSGNSGTQ